MSSRSAHVEVVSSHFVLMTNERKYVMNVNDWSRLDYSVDRQEATVYSDIGEARRMVNRYLDHYGVQSSPMEVVTEAKIISIDGTLMDRS